MNYKYPREQKSNVNFPREDSFFIKKRSSCFIHFHAKILIPKIEGPFRLFLENQKSIIYASDLE